MLCNLVAQFIPKGLASFRVHCRTASYRARSSRGTVDPSRRSFVKLRAERVFHQYGKFVKQFAGSSGCNRCPSTLAAGS